MNCPYCYWSKGDPTALWDCLRTDQFYTTNVVTQITDSWQGLNLAYAFGLACASLQVVGMMDGLRDNPLKYRL